MALLKKIAYIWLVLVGLYLAALYLFPHRESAIALSINRLIQVLLLIISFYLVKKDPSKKNKHIFINFLPVFFLPVVALLYDFVDVAYFSDVKFASFYVSQYYQILHVTFFSFAIVYIVFDLLFHEFRVYQKYILSIAIVFSFSAFLFNDYFTNPQHLYSREEIKQWKSLTAVLPSGGEAPTPAEIATRTNLQTWSNGKPVGELYPQENLRLIERLLPYTEGENWKALFWKPMYVKIIEMNVLLVGFVILFFGYQYKKDPPQGAYVDKIMFIMLLFVSMDILHFWGFIKSIEWHSFQELFGIGQYVSVLIEGLMVLFFMLRLQFITTVQGEFYETELATNPQRISRWRDWVDNWVLAHFFNFKSFNGRLFEKPSQQ